MAELNNELDLTAPAAPTLTLDPIADEAAEAAKLEAPKAEPVKVEDTPLSPEEQKMVNDFAEKIDITNSQMVLQYGAASQKKLSDFSETALSRVKTKDMGETGELIPTLFNGCGFGPPLPLTAASAWTWVDHPVSGLLLLTSRPLKTWFPFGSVPIVLNLASKRNSPDRSTKSTRLCT